VTDPAIAVGTIASSEVAAAWRWFILAKPINRGTMRMPPPTPKAPESTPPITPTSASIHQEGRNAVSDSVDGVTRLRVVVGGLGLRPPEQGDAGSEVGEQQAGVDTVVQNHLARVRMCAIAEVVRDPRYGEAPR
jgi:hypothetical protein